MSSTVTVTSSESKYHGQTGTVVKTIESPGCTAVYRVQMPDGVVCLFGAEECVLESSEPRAAGAGMAKPVGPGGWTLEQWKAADRSRAEEAMRHLASEDPAEAVRQALSLLRLAITNPCLPSAAAADLEAVVGHELALRRWSETLDTPEPAPVPLPNPPEGYTAYMLRQTAEQPSSEPAPAPVPMEQPDYPGQERYDVLQVSDDACQTWLDFCTLRDGEEFRLARRMVDNRGGMKNGHRTADYRIVGGMGNGVKYERQVVQTARCSPADYSGMPRAMLECECQKAGIRYPLGASRAKLASLLSAAK